MSSTAANSEVDDMEPETLEQYTALIRRFLDEAIDAREFESRFLEKFKNETTILPLDVFEVLDELFADVDAFCPDPELCDDDDLNEQQLRAKAAEALAKLTSKQGKVVGPRF
jgi:hypothetical protein